MQQRVMAFFGAALLLAASQAPLPAAEPASAAHAVKREMASYQGSNGAVPVLVVSPAEKGSYPVALYLHGRIGLTETVANHIDAIAERGVVVFVPDYHFAQAIPALAPFDDSDAWGDVQAAIGFIESVNAQYTTLAGGKITIIAQDHGGYAGLLVGTRLAAKVAGLIGIYPLLQNPSAAKHHHLLGFAREVEELKTPTLLVIGKSDRGMRRIQVKRVSDRLQALKRNVRLIEYADAQRCFDWRHSESIADANARHDLLNQIVRFLKANVGGEKLLLLGARGWEVH